MRISEDVPNCSNCFLVHVPEKGVVFAREVIFRQCTPSRACLPGIWQRTSERALGSREKLRFDL
jgi:hypothetical protein